MLYFNWDQAGVNLVPVSSWTMAESGSKQVPVIGVEGIREITVLLAATAAGTLLPSQVIYQGKTAGCHAKVSFDQPALVIFDVFAVRHFHHVLKC